MDAPDLICDTCHLCTRLRTGGIKAMSRGFSGEQTSDKITRQKKMNNFLSRRR